MRRRRYVVMSGNEVLLDDYTWIDLGWLLRRRPVLTVWVFPSRRAALRVVDEWPGGRSWQTVVMV